MTSPILITGASGRIGRALQRVGMERATFVPFAGPRAMGPERALDVADAVAMREVLGEVRPRVVIHLASMVGSACEADPAAAERINVEGTVALAAAARDHGVERIVFASTAAIYGDSRRRAVAETDSPAAKGVYATTKLRAEQALIEKAEHLAVDCLRIFNVYGPAMRDSLVTRLREARPDAPVRLNGLDGFVRDYVHVDDVARALLAAGSSTASGHRVLNVGSGVPRSNRDLLDSFPASIWEAVTLGPEVDSYSCADISVIRRELSWNPVEPWTSSKE